MAAEKKAAGMVKLGTRFKNMSDTNLLLTITIVVFFLMYIGEMLFKVGGFLKPQTFFNMFHANGALFVNA